MSGHADVAAVVLAAGQGTRFSSAVAKVLHRAAGRSLLRHVLDALGPLGLGQIVVVVGHQAADVEAEAMAAGVPGVTTALQAEQRGTGDAAAQALPALDPSIERVLVVPGDTPLVRPETLRQLLAAAPAGGAALLTAELDDPTGYGRVIRADGGVARIVEHDDATPGERAVREVGTSMYVFARAPLTDRLGRLDPDNAQGELYLTDVVEQLVGDGLAVTAHVGPADEVAGVNDRVQLAAAAGALRRRHLETLMRSGVTVIDPDTTWVDLDVTAGPDTVVLPGCLLEGRTRIGAGVTVGPHSHLVDTVVEDGAAVRYAVTEQAHVGPAASVGPFAYLRPGTRLERGARAGGFVEMKKAHVGEGSKVPHLSYVGDAEIGAGVNFSAGAITVNYDGYDKHETVVEDGAFVGCDTMLIAPVTVGRGAFVAAGSAVTEDVPADALGIARQRQTNKAGWARRRREGHDDAGAHPTPEDG